MQPLFLAARKTTTRRLIVEIDPDRPSRCLCLDAPGMSLVSLFNATGGFSWAFNVVRDASLSPSLCEAQPRWIDGSCSADQFTDQITGMARWGSMHQQRASVSRPFNRMLLTCRC
mgnify:CR=1 FL=1